MSSSKYKFIALGTWGLAAIGVVALMVPASPPVLPIGSIGAGLPSGRETAVSIVVERPELRADMSPELMSKSFFLRPSGAKVIAKSTPSPAAPKSLPPPPREQAIAATDLRYLGEVMVEGASKWAFYDAQRQTSFTVAAGESWSVWLCVGKESNNILMRKNEKTYLVPIQK